MEGLSIFITEIKVVSYCERRTRMDFLFLIEFLHFIHRNICGCLLIAYEGGVGEQCSQGFGFIEIKKETI